MRSMLRVLVCLSLLAFAIPGLATAAPPSSPEVTTGGATNVTATTATITGTINPRGSNTTYHFAYGTTDAYGTVTPNRTLASSSSAKPVTENLTGLQPSTTYHYRLFATNSTGQTSGGDVVFTTAAPGTGAPTVVTGPATKVSDVAATLTGTVNANGKATTYHFNYGTTTAYGSVTPDQSTPAGTTDQAVNADISGLLPKTTYHYQLVATNASGSASGADATFTTGPNVLTITAAPPLFTFGRSTVIAGQLTGPDSAGVKVTLSELAYPFTQQPVTVDGITDVNGNYSFTRTPGLNTKYQVSAKTTPPVSSPQVLVRVRFRVSLRLSDSTPARGQVVRFTGIVSPKHDGRTVSIQRKTSTGYTTVARTTLVATTPLANGQTRSKFARRIRIFRNATYRAIVRSDADHVTGVSTRRSAVVH